MPSSQASIVTRDRAARGAGEVWLLGVLVYPVIHVMEFNPALLRMFVMLGYIPVSRPFRASQVQDVFSINSIGGAMNGARDDVFS